jgi:purine-binding chemotaxis protein CheW
VSAGLEPRAWLNRPATFTGFARQAGLMLRRGLPISTPHPTDWSFPMAALETARQFVVFSLGDEEYALPITRVQEIIRHAEPRSVASDDPAIRGVISLRGKIVPVCDLGARLGLATQVGDDSKIVIVETGSGSAGVIVDEVEEVLTLDESNIEPVPGAGADFIEAIAKIDNRLIVLLNLDGVFAGLATAA